jgi:hypothetical protein
MIITELSHKKTAPTVAWSNSHDLKKLLSTLSHLTIFIKINIYKHKNYPKKRKNLLMAG